MSVPGFVKTSACTYLYEPTTTDVEVDNKNNPDCLPPTTILICGWADAKLRHLSKYSDTYKELYPSSRIIIVTAKTLATFFGSQASRIRAVEDMVLNDLHMVSDPLLAQKTGPKNERLLIHAFSNSGMINADAICKVYSTCIDPGRPMSHTALVVDSSPGGRFFWKELSRWSLGVAVGIGPNLPWPQPVTLWLSYIWCTVTMGIPMLFGYPNIAARGRALMNDPTVFDLGAHRLYLYSEKDPLIDPNDIEEHAAEAAAKGYIVHLQKFGNSTHCGHMRMYNQEYWDTVTRVWKTSVKIGTS